MFADAGVIQIKIVLKVFGFLVIFVSYCMEVGCICLTKLLLNESTVQLSLIWGILGGMVVQRKSVGYCNVYMSSI